MALFHCKDSTPCIDPGAPIQNLSAELSDGPEFIGLQFPWVNPDDPIGGDTNRPTDNGDCLGLCTSFTSQEDADLCAARIAFICSHSGGGPGSGNNQPPPAFFYNNLQVCSITCPDGTLYAFRVFPGSFVNTSQAAADEQASAYACAQASATVICIGNIPNACLDQPYSAEINLIGRGQSPFVFSIVAGALPPGLSFTQDSEATANISGTPTASGTYSFTVLVQDSRGNSMQKTFSLGVVGLTNSPPDASQNVAYNFQYTVNGATGATTFFISSGSLPAGLSMDINGLITGTPTTSGSSSFVIEVNDSAGASCQFNSSLNVANPPCDLTTDWLTNPGKCRLRIKNFNAADWVAGGCLHCIPAGGPTWDGTFPTVEFFPLPQVTVAYLIDAGVGNIGGKMPFNGPITCAIFYWNAAGPTGWNVTLVCTGLPQNDYILTVASIVSAIPLQTFVKTGGCAGPANFVIEGYIP